MRIEITNSKAGLLSTFVKAFGAQAKQAVARAVNRTVKGVRTDAVKAAIREYSIKPPIVRKSIKVEQALNGSLEAAAIATGKRIPLIHFEARPKQPGGRRPIKGVSVQVKKERKVLKGSFLARLKSGHVGVFQREGDDRLPIEEKRSLAVPQMLENQDVIEEIQEKAENRFDKSLSHEIDFALQKMGAR